MTYIFCYMLLILNIMDTIGKGIAGAFFGFAIVGSLVSGIIIFLITYFSTKQSIIKTHKKLIPTLIISKIDNNGTINIDTTYIYNIKDIKK